MVLGFVGKGRGSLLLPMFVLGCSFVAEAVVATHECTLEYGCQGGVGVRVRVRGLLSGDFGSWADQGGIRSWVAWVWGAREGAGALAVLGGGESWGGGPFGNGCNAI